MKAVRFHAARDVRVEDVPEPSRKLAPDDVLVKVRYAGICGTDLHEYVAGPIFIPVTPHPLTGATAPQILGHEFGGTVVAVGDQVSHVRPGDRISVQPILAPRSDYYGKRGLYQLSELVTLVGLGFQWGGMSEYAIVKDYCAVPISERMTDKQAALIEPTAVTVYATERATMKPGASVLVAGAGPIGQLQMLAARAAGASRVFISDPNRKRLDFAREVLPDCIPIDPTREKLQEVVLDMTDGHVGVDVVFECAGNERALATGIDAVRRQGVVVQVGLHVSKASIDYFPVVAKDIDIRGSWAYSTLMWPRVASLIESGQLPAERVVTRTIGINDAISDGFDALIDPAGTQSKILIDMTI